MPGTMLWIPALLLIVVAGFWWLRRSSAPSAKPVTPASRAPAQAARVAAPAAAPKSVVVPPVAVSQPAAVSTPVADETEPATLAQFQWRDAQAMDPAHRESLLTAVKGIPRPPRSMQRLLSPDFVARASSNELSDLVMGEPLIAGKVLATVNAPLYGLRQPVTSIGQAVTFLGMNSVRSICLQYMLAEAFKPKLAEAQKAFDIIWQASALASELAIKLSGALKLPNPGSLATQVVLSFVGQLATASLLPASGMPSWLARGRLERARLEQELLGLNATEIGALLMQSWELPASLVNDVKGIGQQLTADPGTTNSDEGTRRAVAYLCAVLGERLASGQMTTLLDHDPLQDESADTFHLRQRLRHPALARLPQALASSEVQTAVEQMLAGARPTT